MEQPLSSNETHRSGQIANRLDGKVALISQQSQVRKQLDPQVAGTAGSVGISARPRT